MDRIKPRVCPYPKGIGSYSNTILTPSRKIIIASNFREILKRTEIDEAEYIDSKFNSLSTIGTSQLANVYHTEYYVKHHNTMLIRTGDGGTDLFRNNVSPNVVAKHKFIYDEITGEEIENFNSNENLIGNINSWSICAMDYDQFVKLCKQKHQNVPIDNWIYELEGTVVETGRDTMTFTNHYFVENSHNGVLAEMV